MAAMPTGNSSLSLEHCKTCFDLIAFPFGRFSFCHNLHETLSSCLKNQIFWFKRDQTYFQNARPDNPVINSRDESCAESPENGERHALKSGKILLQQNSDGPQSNVTTFIITI
jgi:hypothetical protein